MAEINPTPDPMAQLREEISRLSPEGMTKLAERLEALGQGPGVAAVEEPAPKSSAFDALRMALQPTVEAVMSKERISAAFAEGRDVILRDLGVGPRPSTREFFSPITEPNEKDGLLTRATKRLNKSILESGVRSLDEAAGVVEGLVFAGVQAVDEVAGLDDTQKNSLIRELNQMLMFSMGAGFAPTTRFPLGKIKAEIERVVPAGKRTEALNAADRVFAEELENLSGAFAEQRPLEARAVDRAFDRFQARFTDALRPVEIAARKAGEKPFAENFTEAYVGMRNIAGLQEAVGAAYKFGPPKVVPDGYRFAPGVKSLNQIFEPFQASGDLPDLALYFGARGAQRLKGRNLELPPEMTDRALQAGLELGKRRPDFKKAFEDYQRYNNAILDFAVDTQLIDKETKKRFTDAAAGNFVPFYRVVEDVATGQPTGRNPFRRLVGGSGKINSVFDNIYSNSGMWIELGMKNRAKRRVYDMLDNAGLKEFAERVERPIRMGKVLEKDLKKAGAESMETFGLTHEEALHESLQLLLSDIAEHPIKSIVRNKPLGQNVDVVYRNGKPNYYRLNDPDFVASMKYFDPQVLPFSLRVFAGFKNAFTTLVVASPEFQVFNFIRDTQSAYVNSPNFFLPGIDSLRGVASRMRNSPDFQLAMLNGMGFSSTLKGEIAATRRLPQAYKNAGIDYNRVLDSANKVSSFGFEALSALEVGARLRQFQKSREGGEGLMKSAFEGREVSTDFGIGGAGPVAEIMGMTIPFARASIRGWEKTLRTGVQHPVRTAMRGFVGITLPSLILYNMFADDPDYQALPSYIRDLHMSFKLPGDNKFYHIPYGFESGAALGAIPVRIMEAIEQRHGKRFARMFVSIIANQARIGLVPQIAEPIRQLQANTRFPGIPIVPSSLENVRPSEQFRPWTNATLVAMARELKDHTGIEMSPMQTEALIKGYVGTIGYYLMDATDYIGRNLTDRPARPERRWDETFGVRRFVSELPLKHSQFGADFYDLLTESRMALVTMTKLRKEMDEARLEKLSDVEMENNLRAINRSAERVAQKSAKLGLEIRRVWESDVSPKQKRQEVDAVLTEQNALFEDFMRSTPKDILKELGLPAPGEAKPRQ